MSANQLAIQDSDPVRSRGGTRFRLFPQPPFLKHYRTPVVVRLSPRAGSVGPGPADNRMYVVEPIGKQRPYGIVPGPFGTPFVYLPTWDGPVQPPAMPGPRGDFDGIEIGTPAFEAAHLYACVRWTLDIWEKYLGEVIAWHFARDYSALEIALLPQFDNAHSGYGFLEVGADDTGEMSSSFALNYDVVAHETGHLIIYSLLGVPDPGTTAAEYQGFHESAADLVAMLGAAHFESVVDQLFLETSGNLYVLNELNRFAETSEQTQIRLASNVVKMSAFADGWSDEHDLSLPLTGAIFDILCDIYHRLLIESGLIGRALVELVSLEHLYKQNEPRIQKGFDAAYAAEPAGFRQAFYGAREQLGFYLAETWRRLSPDWFSYATVGKTMLAVDRDFGGRRFQEAIASSFRWREIGAVQIGPRKSDSTRASHLRSARTVTPAHRKGLPRMSYRERWAIARGV